MRSKHGLLKHGLFNWQVTRVVFSVGIFAVMTGIFRFVLTTLWARVRR